MALSSLIGPALQMGGQFMQQGQSDALFGIQQQAQMAQERNSARNQMAQIGAQMRSENRKTQAQIHQINQETNTKISEMQRETYINKRKSSDKIHDKVKQLMMA